MPIEAGKIRNVAVVGHRGTGKTSLVEALLFQAGKTNRLGTIEAGVRTALGDVDAARAILEELTASAEERGFVRLAAFYGRELAALGSGGRD